MLWVICASISTTHLTDSVILKCMLQKSVCIRVFVLETKEWPKYKVSSNIETIKWCGWSDGDGPSYRLSIYSLSTTSHSPRLPAILANISASLDWKYFLASAVLKYFPPCSYHWLAAGQCWQQPTLPHQYVLMMMDSQKHFLKMNKTSQNQTLPGDFLNLSQLFCLHHQFSHSPARQCCRFDPVPRTIKLWVFKLSKI